MKSVYYITESDFKKEHAPTSRVYHNALSINSIKDYHVTIVGYGDTSTFSKNQFLIKNVKRGKGNVQKIFYYLFRGLCLINLINREKNRPDIIIYYGIQSRILLPLLIYCRINKIKIVTDVAEWYDYSHLFMGRYGILALDIHLAMTKLIPKCDGIITISTFLENYFKKKGKPIQRIPVTIDTKNINTCGSSNIQFDINYLNLVYAGIPGKKDLLMNVIEAVQQLNDENCLVKLHLIGPDSSVVKKASSGPDCDNIIYHGRIAHHKVREYLYEADFSVLLRPDKRYAHAGFPTKFVESLGAGLPVIANLTSDLSLYLKDGINGFVVNNPSIEELKIVIRTILKFDRSYFNMLKLNAKETAKENFDYRLYIPSFKNFFEKVLNN